MRRGLLELTAAILLTLGAIGAAIAAQPPQFQNAQVDYEGFEDLTREAEAVREKRLVSLQTFKRMAGESDTIILDTRSGMAFAMGHWDGAVHLNFSDFTDDKLAKVIPSKETRILIYCNNNFSDNVDPVPVKRAPLALNIPTFINLYGYGYKNIYELGDITSIEALGEDWVSSPSFLEETGYDP